MLVKVKLANILWHSLNTLNGDQHLNVSSFTPTLDRIFCIVIHPSYLCWNSSSFFISWDSTMFAARLRFCSLVPLMHYCDQRKTKKNDPLVCALSPNQLNVWQLGHLRTEQTKKWIIDIIFLSCSAAIAPLGSLVLVTLSLPTTCLLPYQPPAYLPTNYLPTNNLPTNHLPTTCLPSAYLPTNYLPTNHLPTNCLPINLKWNLYGELANVPICKA